MSGHSSRQNQSFAHHLTFFMYGSGTSGTSTRPSSTPTAPNLSHIPYPPPGGLTASPYAGGPAPPLQYSTAAVVAATPYSAPSTPHYGGYNGQSTDPAQLGGIPSGNSAASSLYGGVSAVTPQYGSISTAVSQYGAQPVAAQQFSSTSTPYSHLGTNSAGSSLYNDSSSAVTQYSSSISAIPSSQYSGHSSDTSLYQNNSATVGDSSSQHYTGQSRSTSSQYSGHTDHRSSSFSTSKSSGFTCESQEPNRSHSSWPSTARRPSHGHQDNILSSGQREFTRQPYDRPKFFRAVQSGQSEQRRQPFGSQKFSRLNSGTGGDRSGVPGNRCGPPSPARKGPIPTGTSAKPGPLASTSAIPTFSSQKQTTENPQRQQDIEEGKGRAKLTGVKRKGLAGEILAETATTHHITWAQMWDKEFPAELMEKCKPLFCELCTCRLTSPLQAKMHYEGKSHDKHVRSYFIHLADFPQQQIPRKLGGGKMERLGGSNTSFTCELCSVHFNSETHLEQHIQGKNHKRRMENKSSHRPGYFNKETKRWQKTQTGETVTSKTDTRSSPATTSDSLTGGTAGKSVPNNSAGHSNTNSGDSCTATTSTGALPSQPAAGTLAAKSVQERQLEAKNKFFCETCKVGAPTQSQLDLHLNGKNHKNRMKMLGGVGNNDLNAIEKRVKFKDKIMTTMAKGQTVQGSTAADSSTAKDLSIYRTPSGHFYCSSCNITVNSEPQFLQHQTSKKHKQKELVQKMRK